MRYTENTIVPGSLAAGEAGGASVHGDRLGANCWLGLVVVGRQAAVTTAELAKPNGPAVQLPTSAGEASTTCVNESVKPRVQSQSAEQMTETW